MTTNKWADYCISAVQYNNAHTHIQKVWAYNDNWDKLWEYIEYSRNEIISMIKNRKTFVTTIKGSDGKWKKWQPVFIVVINNTEYIKTVSNNKTEDNLEDLPEF